MVEEQMDAVIASLREQAAAEMRNALESASPAVLQKIAVDIVPALVRVSYSGQPWQIGARFADAIAIPAVAGLPAILVRVHRGDFDGADGKSLFDALKEADASQAAIAVIGGSPATVRQHVGTLARWLFDTDGLVNLMLNANVGVTVKTYEAKTFDASYFA